MTSIFVNKFFSVMSPGQVPSVEKLLSFSFVNRVSFSQKLQNEAASQF